MPKLPKAGSVGEETFAMHCKIYELTPEREYKFHPERKWRFDFAFPHHKVAVEIEGGTWSGGRHSRGSGMAADMEKYNEAAKLEWLVFRFSTEMVSSGEAIDFMKQVLK
jgi:very-short-patch-repair endonuclease